MSAGYCAPIGAPPAFVAAHVSPQNGGAAGGPGTAGLTPSPVRRGDHGPGPDPRCGIMVVGAGAEAGEGARNGKVGEETG